MVWNWLTVLYTGLKAVIPMKPKVQNCLHVKIGESKKYEPHPETASAVDGFWTFLPIKKAADKFCK